MKISSSLIVGNYEFSTAKQFTYFGSILIEKMKLLKKKLKTICQEIKILGFWSMPREMKKKLYITLINLVIAYVMTL
jgi:hypothetical protein